MIVLFHIFGCLYFYLFHLVLGPLGHLYQNVVILCIINYQLKRFFPDPFFISQFQTVTLMDGEQTIRTRVSADEIKQRVVGGTADMFTTAKRLYTSFSSMSRPSATFVIGPKLL